MDDLSKYIFDPNDPHACKVYDLLLTIVKEQNSLLFLDPFFFAAFYEKEIFTPKTIERIWDKPDNFSSLNSYEKSKCYILSYSLDEFEEYLISLGQQIEWNHTQKLFPESIMDVKWHTLSLKGADLSAKNALRGTTITKPTKPTWEVMKGKEKSGPLSFSLNMSRHNIVYCSTSGYSEILPTLRPQKTSLWLTLEKEYEAYTSHKHLPKQFRPLLLKDMGHLPLLFEFIRRDLHRATETQTAPNETTSIELLSSINVKDYFCLHDIQLANLDQSKEIYFIGENGDGKTILLQSILLALRGNQNQGVVIDFIKQNPFDDMELTATTADQQTYRFETNPKEQTNSYPFVFAYGVNRFRNDSDQKDTEGYLSLFSHEQYLENPVKWLQHLDYREARQLPTPVSLELAKHFLETVLNDNVVIDVNPDRVTFTERGTPLEFEQLSDGYKSVLIWLCDLIARLTESQPNVDALEHYQGIVLIDEIGVFLHPKWQVQIVKKLRSTLKQVQFLFTTHSPTIILGASRDALIYRLYKEEGQTRLSEPIPNQSLSEQMANAVLTAPFLFGLDTARSAAFEQGTDTLDTSDDYLSGIIHRLVTEQLIGKPHINQSELLTLVKKTLADYKANKTA